MQFEATVGVAVVAMRPTSSDKLYVDIKNGTGGRRSYLYS